MTFMLKSENQKDIDKIVKKFVSTDSTIHADESDAYDILHAHYQVKRVNHSIEYFNKVSKACTNQAESFFEETWHFRRCKQKIKKNKSSKVTKRE